MTATASPVETPVMMIKGSFVGAGCAVEFDETMHHPRLV